MGKHIMVTYEDAVAFVNANAGQLRFVVISGSFCSSCVPFIEMLTNSGVNFVVMDYESSGLVFKPGGAPSTFAFSAANNCYARYDVFDSRMLGELIAKIAEWDAQ